VAVSPVLVVRRNLGSGESCARGHLPGRSKCLQVASWAKLGPAKMSTSEKKSRTKQLNLPGATSIT